VTTAIPPDAAAFQRQKVCIIVCGMHRAGTSAVTRVLNLLGAEVAQELVQAQPDNIRGYWEPSAAVRIHNQMLEALGSSSSDPLPLPADWLTSTFAQQARLQLADMINAEFAASRLFVVKDPRVSRILPLWLELLDDLDIETVVVIPFRNPLEVAASLKDRDGMSLKSSLLLYIYSYLGTEAASRGRRRCFVRYDQLLDDWHELDRKLRGILGSRLPPVSLEQSSEIERFLTPGLYHHRHSRNELVRMPGVPAIAIELFDLLNDAAEGGDETALRRSFDDRRRRADEADAMFRELVIGERDRLVSERDTMRENIRTIERSTSWRITQPLRWAKRQHTAWTSRFRAPRSP